MLPLHRGGISINIRVLFILLYVITIGSVQGLKCYICHTDDNELCSNELQDCPSDQAYDRCMTTIYKNPIDGLHIKKECALAPCHLRGLGNLNFANFKSDCDSSPEDCVYCCGEDGCNKDSAFGSPPVNLQLLCLMLISLYLLYQ